MFLIFARRILPPVAKVHRWYLFSTTCSIAMRAWGRVVQNIGGIANLTAIRAGDPSAGGRLRYRARQHGDRRRDRALFGKPYDRDGRIAASGKVLDLVVQQLLRAPFFRRKPPKTAGREEFGREFAGEFLRRCKRARKQDVVATATALTAHSIADALRRHVLPGGAYGEFIVAGGGANNPALIAMLTNQLHPLGLRLRCSDEFGLPAAAKEAAAFALLAYETWNQRPSNLPSATGARRPAILGKVSYA